MNNLTDELEIKQSIKDVENKKKTIDYKKLQKMVFVYNALEDGWKLKKWRNGYVCTKNKGGKKEVYFRESLSGFMERTL